MSTTVIAQLQAEDAALSEEMTTVGNEARGKLEQYEAVDSAAQGTEREAFDVLEKVQSVRAETKRMKAYIAEIPTKAAMEALLGNVAALRKRKGNLKTKRADVEKQLGVAKRSRETARTQYARHLDTMWSQVEVLISKVSAQPFGYWGGEKKVRAAHHVAALGDMCVQREQVWRDMIHAVNTTTDTDTAATNLVTTAEQSSEADLGSVLDEHGAWKRQVEESYEKERKRLVTKYKDLAKLNREYAFHIYRGTCYKSGTKPTRREVDLLRRRDDLSDEVQALNSDFEKVRCELVQLQSQHESYETDVAAGMSAFNTAQDQLNAQLADVKGFIRALKEEKGEWDVLKKALDVAGSRR